MDDEEFSVTIRLRVEDDTAQPLRASEQRLSSFQKTVNQAQQTVQKLSNTRANVQLSLQDKLSSPLKTVQSGLQKLIAKPYNVVVGIAQKGGDLVQGALGKIGGALSGVLGAVASPITAALAGVASLGAAIGAGTKGVGLASDLQQATIAFEQMLGSGAKAQQLLTDLQKFAAATPFEFPELRDATRQLLAYGFAADDVVKMLTPIGDAVAGLGGTFANEGQRIVRALGQMQAKGKISTEELMQLQEMGVPALQLLAEGFGKTTEEMQDMVSSGLVPADQGIKLILDGLGRRFPDMMARQSRTLAGLKSTLSDTFNNQLLLRFGQGIAEQIQPRLERVVDWLSANEETVTAWGDALFKVGSVLANVVLSGLELVIRAAQMLTPVLAGVQSFFTSLGESGAGGELRKALTNITEAAQLLWDVLSPLLLPVLEVLLNLVGTLLSAAFRILIQVILALSERILKAVQDFAAFVALCQTVWSWLQEKLTPAFHAVGDAAQRVGDIVAGLVETFQKATTAISGFMDKAGAVAGAVGGAVGGAAAAVAGAVGTAGATMAGATPLGPQAQAAAQRAIAKGTALQGSKDFINLCLKFVDDMFGTTGANRKNTAWEAAQTRATTVGGSLADVPAGMVAYLRADPSNQGAGHVMISQGGGKFLDPSYKGVRTAQPGDELWDYYSKLYYGYGPGGNLNAQTMSMQAGGILSEPVMGLGMRTGTPYTFGEGGPEAVTPLGGTKSGGAQHVSIGTITVATGSGDPGEIREAVVAGVLDALAEAYEQIAPNVR